LISQTTEQNVTRLGFFLFENGHLFVENSDPQTPSPQSYVKPPALRNGLSSLDTS
jgi:hypothetical protein